MAKICCGGFYLGEGLELDGRTLKATGGSGLPDPSELADGTAAVVVNGEWKMQEGYGYTDAPAFEPIEWDGETSGKPYVEFYGTPTFYKVSDDIITAEQFIGAIIGIDTPIGEQTVVIPEEQIVDFGGLSFVYSQILSGVAGTYGEGEEEFNVPENGTYFIFMEVEGTVAVNSLTAAPSVHQFDPALIPTSGVEEFVVKFEQGDDGIVADATWEDVTMALSSGKLPKGIFYINGMTDIELQFYKNYFINISVGAQNTLKVTTIHHDDTSEWSSNFTSYPLTPAAPSEDGAYVLTCTITDGEAVYSWETNA